MEIYICTGKQTNGSTVLYQLQNCRNNIQSTVTGDILKDGMRNKKVEVMNLTLTSDNRLVEAGKDKQERLIGFAKTPDWILNLDGFQPLKPEYDRYVEDLMDSVIKECIEKYVGSDVSKYVKIKSFNKDNNTCVLEFTLGMNSYVLLEYDKTIYGMTNQSIYWDIGVRPVAISNRCDSMKLDEAGYVLASKHSRIGAISMQYVISNGELNWQEIRQIDEVKKFFGKSILEHVSNQLIQVCEKNPNIANNTNVGDYISYDHYKKAYIKNTGVRTGATIAAAVVLGGVTAAAVALNPDIVQTGLLAKIAGFGGGNILNIYKILIGSGGAIGALTGGGIMLNTTSGIIDKKELKEKKQAVKRDWQSPLGKLGNWFSR